MTLVAPLRRITSVKLECLPALNELLLCGHLQSNYRSILCRGLNSKSSTDQVYQRPFIDAQNSYVFGRSNDYLTYTTLNNVLKQVTRNHPNKLAIVSQTENVKKTFKEFHDDVNRLIKGLITVFGVSKGDYVGIFAYNCFKWPLIQIACSMMGAILIPVNPSNKHDELAYILKKGHIKLLFMPGPKSPQSQLNDHVKVLNSTSVTDLESNNELLLRHVVIMDDEEYSCGELASSWKLKNVSLTNWSQVFENDGDLGTLTQDFDLNDVTPEDIMGIYFTSGTTGKPKGACVSHFTAINNVMAVQRRIYGQSREWEKNRIICNPLPMFHIFAGVLNTLGIFVEGNTIVYTGPKYDINTIVRSIIDHSCNVLIGTPTILIDLLAVVEEQKLSLQLKTIQSGGAPLKPEVVNRAYKLLPELEGVIIGYGSTENGGVATVQSIHEPPESRPFSVGPPIDFTELRIVDKRTGHTVELGEEGEVQTRGSNTMIGYFEDDAKTAEVLTPSGWYCTGDLGKILPHGSLQISGRIKELIIKGGENVYPKEVEDMLLNHEAIEDVHVVGVPDERFGEEICAWVKLKAHKIGKINETEIREFCKSRITYFKVPKYVLFVEDFPMTPTKKAQKHLMKAKSIELLKLKPQQPTSGSNNK